MIVVDTNVVIYLFLEGEYTAQAEAVLEYDDAWSAPLLWRSEFRNVLTLYLRKKILNYAQILKILEQSEELLKDREFQVSSEAVFELVKRSTCSAYDCEYVALAKELKAPLVTADKKILHDFPEIALSLQSFAKARK